MRVLIYSLYVFFGELSVQILCPFKKGLISFENSLYVLDISLMRHVASTYFLPICVASFYSFKEQKF